MIINIEIFGLWHVHRYLAVTVNVLHKLRYIWYMTVSVWHRLRYYYDIYVTVKERVNCFIFRIGASKLGE